MIDPHRARRPRDCGMRSSLRATYMLHLLALIDVQWRSMSSINVYMQVFYISTLITLPGSSPVGGAVYPPPLTSINAGERGFLTFWLPVVSSRFQSFPVAYVVKMSSKCRHKTGPKSQLHHPIHTNNLTTQTNKPRPVDAESTRRGQMQRENYFFRSPMNLLKPSLMCSPAS